MKSNSVKEKIEKHRRQEKDKKKGKKKLRKIYKKESKNRFKSGLSSITPLKLIVIVLSIAIPFIVGSILIYFMRQNDLKFISQFFREYPIKELIP